MRGFKRFGGVLGGLAVGAMISASSANASTSIGEADGHGFARCDAGMTWVQNTTDPSSPSYAVPPGGGVITSWSHDVSSDTGATAVLRLKLFRATTDPSTYPTTYLTVGESEAVTDMSDGLQTFPTRISVSGGELLGLHTSGTGIDCVRNGVGSDRTEASTPGADPPVGTSFTGVYANTWLLNVAAVIEPDADADGFGDETQDDCPTDASTQGACPDTDNDGVFDAQDLCPAVAGPASTDGCPDADGDGTPDVQDNCPAVTGPASNAGCPLPDTSAPETTITSGPTKTDSRRVKFGFDSSEAGSTFECKLKGKKVRKDSLKQYAPCTSKKKYRRLKPGKYRFFVRATDAAGNVDPTPAKQKFKIVKDL